MQYGWSVTTSSTLASDGRLWTQRRTTAAVVSARARSPGRSTRVTPGSAPNRAATAVTTLSTSTPKAASFERSGSSSIPLSNPNQSAPRSRASSAALTPRMTLSGTTRCAPGCPSAGERVHPGRREKGQGGPVAVGRQAVRKREVVAAVLVRHAVGFVVRPLREQQRPGLARGLEGDTLGVKRLQPRGERVGVVVAGGESTVGVPIDLRLRATERQDGAAVLARHRQGPRAGFRRLEPVEQGGPAEA